MFSRENLIRSLQGWICMVGVVALGNSISCFIDHSFLGTRLYTVTPDKANDLAARLSGVWTLVTALLRVTCAICIHNRALYNLTLLSFFIALMHFLSEVYIFRTAQITVGVLTTIIIASLSTLFMIIGFWLLKEEDRSDLEEFPKSVEDIIFNKNRKTNNKRSKKD